MQLISPFVGRIYDWYKSRPVLPGMKAMAGANDGVKSVQRIYNHYKQHGIATEVMGARVSQCGPDHRAGGLRFAHHRAGAAGRWPTAEAPLARALDAASPCQESPAVQYDEAAFRWHTERRRDGHRSWPKAPRLAVDTFKLEALMKIYP